MNSAGNYENIQEMYQLSVKLFGMHLVQLMQNSSMNLMFHVHYTLYLEGWGVNMVIKMTPDIEKILGVGYMVVTVVTTLTLSGLVGV
jgi:hypothetical protein